MPTRWQAITLTHYGLVMPHGVNIGLGNGLLPDGTKPLPEPKLTYHQLGPVTITHGKFNKIYLSHHLLNLTWKFDLKIFIQLSQGSMS